MNTPNKLTMLRIILCPFFLFFLLASWIPYHFLYALLIYIAASVTDTIDGNLARKYQLVTDFGTFLDPLADKVLVTCALVAFIELGLTGSAPVIIILAREFLVTSLRLVAAGHGKVIAAGNLGKLKTVITLVSVIGILALLSAQELGWFLSLPTGVISRVLIWICAGITVWSGIDYLCKNYSHIDYRN